MNSLIHNSTNKLYDSQYFRNNSQDSLCKLKLDFTANEILESIEEEAKFFMMKEKEFDSYEKMIELIRRPPEKFSSDEDSAEGESKEDSEDEDYHFKKDIKCVDDKSVNELREIQIKYQNKPHKLLFSQKYQEISSEIDEQLEMITSQSNCTHSSDIYKSKIQAKDDEICMLRQRLIEKEKECENEKSKNVEKEKQLSELHNIIKNSQKSYQELISKSQS